MQLVQRLIRRGVIPESDLTRVSEAHFAAPSKPLHELLIERGFAKEEDVLAALAEEFGMELVDLTQIKIEPDTLQAMPLKLVHRRTLMPLSRNNGTLVVATGDPFDVYALDELQMLTGLQIQPVLASPREIARLIKTHFGVGGETVTAMMQERTDDVELLEGLEADDSEVAKMAQEASRRQAGQRNPHRGGQRAGQRHSHRAGRGACASATASTACCKRSRCRRRSTASRPPSSAASRSWPGSTSPRSGCRRTAASRCASQNREIDVRVSIIPMIHGEGIVMRLLDKGRMVFNLANVGMLPDTYKLLSAS